jgi:hypothetical protein
MRKTLTAALLIFVAASSNAMAQDKADLSGMAGYAFGASVDVLTGKVKVEDAAAYSATLGFKPQRNSQVELNWTYHPTDLRYTPFTAPVETIGLDVHYFQIGGMQEFPSGQAKPFVKFSLGATYFNPASGNLGGVNVSSEWRFSMMLGLGAKYFFSPRVGLRLQGDLIGTFLSSSGGVFCGFGGCSLGLFGYGMWSGDLMGGLTIAM